MQGNQDELEHDIYGSSQKEVIFFDGLHYDTKSKWIENGSDDDKKTAYYKLNKTLANFRESRAIKQGKMQVLTRNSNSPKYEVRGYSAGGIDAIQYLKKCTDDDLKSIKLLHLIRPAMYRNWRCVKGFFAVLYFLIFHRNGGSKQDFVTQLARLKKHNIPVLIDLGKKDNRIDNKHIEHFISKKVGEVTASKTDIFANTQKTYGNNVTIRCFSGRDHIYGGDEFMRDNADNANICNPEVNISNINLEFPTKPKNASTRKIREKSQVRSRALSV